MSPSLSVLSRLGLSLSIAIGAVSTLQAQSEIVENRSSQVPQDRDPFGVLSDFRLAAPRDLNDYFSFQVPNSIPEWETQKQVLRQKLRFALGLLPAPKIDVIDPVIHGTKAYDGYQISKVFFQSMPGFYVTGSLYRPLGPIDSTQKRPGILCPHGHWANGRFVSMTDEEVKEALTTGAESMECAARSPLQARCVNLARMGCVVFHYDMIGYADSIQIPDSVAHRFASQRIKLSGSNEFGLFSPAAEMHNNSVMALQTYNSIACLDFLESLEDVDRNRLAVTGASGGGTQSFILAALDDRLAVSFPAVMVGTAMQGGCTCENCSNLRTFQGNVHFAAMFAPKPQGMTAADDWTVELETKGFPELQQLYSMYGKSENVHLTSRTKFGHNYNQVGREAMYQWMGRHLAVTPLPEREFTLLTADQMSVWKTGLEDDKQVFNERTEKQEAMPQLKTGPAFEQSLLKWINTNRQASGSDDQTLENSEVWQFLYLAERRYGEPLKENKTRWERVRSSTLDTEPAIVRTDWKLLRNDQQVTPVRIFQKIETETPRPQLMAKALLWLGNDVEELTDRHGELIGWAKQKVDAGQTIVQVDLFGKGEFQRVGDFQMLQPWQKTSREFAGYVYGYNLPPAVRRAHDVIDTIVALQQLTDEQKCALEIVATGDGAIATTLAAPALATMLKQDSTQMNIDAIQVQLDGFRFSQVHSLIDGNFVPGVLNWGDAPKYWEMFAVRAGKKGDGTKIVIYDDRISDWTDVLTKSRTIELRSSAAPR